MSSRVVLIFITWSRRPFYIQIPGFGLLLLHHSRQAVTTQQLGCLAACCQPRRTPNVVAVPATPSLLHKVGPALCTSVLCPGSIWPTSVPFNQGVIYSLVLSGCLECLVMVSVPMTFCPWIVLAGSLERWAVALLSPFIYLFPYALETTLLLPFILCQCS